MVSTNQPSRLPANSPIRHDGGVWSNTALLTPDKDHRDGLLDIKCCHELGNEEWIRWEGLGLVVGEVGAGELGEKLICLQLLSLIACACLTGSITVNHCGSTSLLRHTILSPPSPQTNDLIHQQCMMGEPLEHSLLKPSDQEGVWGFVLQLPGWGDPHPQRL